MPRDKNPPQQERRGNCPATGYAADHNMVQVGHNLECSNGCGYGYPNQ